MDFQVRSDLASECDAERDLPGVRMTEAEAGGCRILRVQVKDEAAAAAIGKPCGRYVTLHRPRLCELTAEEGEEVRRALAVELREMAERMTGKRLNGRFSLLVAGLGNSLLTPDALGPEAVSHLRVTRRPRRGEHLPAEAQRCEISAITAGVLCRTGLEAAEMVRGAAEEVCPDLVLAVDARAARRADNLFSTVQLSDTGIRPGSGIGGNRLPLTRETVGVPVLALGIPTAVECSTLIHDVLSSAGHLPREARQAAAASLARGMFVSPTESDLLLPQAALLLADAIEKAFSLPSALSEEALFPSL